MSVARARCPRRDRDRVHAGARRDGPGPPRRRAARAPGGVYEPARGRGRSRRRGGGPRRTVPVELGGAGGAGAAQLGPQRSSSSSTRSSCSAQASTSPGANSSAGAVARTLRAPSPSSRPSATPRAIASTAGSPKPSYSDARQNTAGAAVERVEHRPRLRAEDADERPVEAAHLAPPGRTGDDQREVGMRAPELARPRARGWARSLRGSTVPTVSTYGGWTPARATGAVDLVGVARRGRVDPERDDRDAARRANPSRSSSRAVKSDGDDHEPRVPRARARARGCGS